MQKNLATRAKTALIKVDRALRQLPNASIDIISKKYLIAVLLLFFYTDQKYGEWITANYRKHTSIIVQLSNDIFLLKRVSRYGRCFMIDSGSKGCPEQESAGCHFGTLGRNFLRGKTKWPPNISRSNMIFQQMKPGTSVIPHFHVILTGQSISCNIFMI